MFKINALAATVKDCCQALVVAARGGGGKAAVANLMESVAVFFFIMGDHKDQFCSGKPPTFHSLMAVEAPSRNQFIRRGHVVTHSRYVIREDGNDRTSVVVNNLLHLDVHSPT